MKPPDMARVHAATRLVGDRLEAERLERIRCREVDRAAQEVVRTRRQEFDQIVDELVEDVLTAADQLPPVSGPCCEHWSATSGTCESRRDVRRFLTGDRCPDHTPAAIAGRGETIPDPARTMAGLRDAWLEAMRAAA